MKILHISDLHLTDKDDFEKRLSAFIEAIGGISFDVCALTGDFKNWNADWSSAVRFVNTLTERLDIENLLVVPGNHDIPSSDAFVSYDKHSGDCSLRKDRDGQKISDQYNVFVTEFIDKIKGANICHPGLTHSVKQIDGINFVLIDSVYALNASEAELEGKVKIPAYPFCSNCAALETVFGGLKSENTIAVTHIPFTDACQSLKHDYGAIDINKLEERFYACLAGHVHTKQNTKYKIVGSNGFMTDDFNCAIYDLSVENGKITAFHRTEIAYSGSKKCGFDAGLSQKDLCEVFELSAPSLKKHLFGRVVTDGNASDMIENSFADGHTLNVNGNEFSEKDISALFGSICELKHIDNGKVKETESFGARSDIPSRIIEILKSEKFLPEVHKQLNNQLLIPVTLKGPIGTGKSTFFNILYWEMLLRQKKHFEYIPVLIDMAKIERSELTAALERVSELNAVYNKPIYILLDGLDNCQIYNKDLEELGLTIERMLEGVECSVVFNVNQHYKSFVERKNENRRNPFEFIEKNKTSEYLLYFKPVSHMDRFFRERLYDFDKKKPAAEPLAEFIDTYFRLSDCSDETKKKALCNLIEDNPALELDFNLLYSFSKKTINHSGSTYGKLNSLYNINAETQQAAVKYFLTTDFLNAEESAMLKSKSIINLAFAKYVISVFDDEEKICEYISFQSKDSPIPQRYFNTHLNCFIKIYLEGLNNRERIITNIKNALDKFVGGEKKKVNFVAVAQLIYILRHAKADKKELNDLTEKIVKLISDPWQNEGDHSRTRDVAIRTLDVSEIALGDKSVYDHLDALTEENGNIELNRCFSLFYYGDRYEIDSGDGNDEDLVEFEYYNTFVHLYYRIFKQIEKPSSQWRRDFELDLFTLCNIVQIRAQQLFMADKLDANRKFFVYNTVALLYSLLKLYFGADRQKMTEQNRKIYYYFRSVQNDFGHLLITYYDSINAVDKIEELFEFGDERKNVENRERLRSLVCLPFVGVKTRLELIDELDITKVTRSGWSKQISIKKNGRGVRAESVAEHSFSLMLLTMFSDIPSEWRNDLLVLSFIHDLAEKFYGDKCPFDSDYGQTETKIKNTTLSLCYLGTYDGFPNLAKHAALVSKYLYPKYTAVTEQVNVFDKLDKLQMGIKLIQYFDSTDYTVEISEKRFDDILDDIEKTAENGTKLFEMQKEVIERLRKIKAEMFGKK